MVGHERGTYQSQQECPPPQHPSPGVLACRLQTPVARGNCPLHPILLVRFQSNHNGIVQSFTAANPDNFVLSYSLSRSIYVRQFSCITYCFYYDKFTHKIVFLSFPLFFPLCADDFPVQQDATQNDNDMWQQMALVMMTRALQSLGEKMEARAQQPLDKRGDAKSGKSSSSSSSSSQTTVRRGGQIQLAALSWLLLGFSTPSTYGGINYRLPNV